MEKKTSKKVGTKALNKALVMPSLPTMDEIKLEPVYGSTYCQITFCRLLSVAA
jgi:hypothetical protein